MAVFWNLSRRVTRRHRREISSRSYASGSFGHRSHLLIMMKIGTYTADAVDTTNAGLSRSPRSDTNHSGRPPLHPSMFLSCSQMSVEVPHQDKIVSFRGCFHSLFNNQHEKGILCLTFRCAYINRIATVDLFSQIFKTAKTS